MSLTRLRLSNAEQAQTGFTHKIKVDFTDLVAFGAVLSGAIDLAPYIAGYALRDAAMRVKTGFVGATTLTCSVGWNGATTDDAGGAIAATSMLVAGTCALANGPAFATLLTGYAPADAGVYQAAFVATGAALNALTAGEVVILLKLVDLTVL